MSNQIDNAAQANNNGIRYTSADGVWRDFWIPIFQSLSETFSAISGHYRLRFFVEENLVRYLLGRFLPSFFLKSYIIEFVGIFFRAYRHGWNHRRNGYNAFR